MGLVILFAFAALLVVLVGTAGLLRQLQRPPRKTYAVALARDLPTDPADLKLGAEHVVFRFDGGGTSPGWVIGGERAHGPTVVISHGWADSRFGALTRVPFVTPLASRVVVYDLRAHGDSTAKPCTLGALEVDDLIAVVDQVDDGGPIVLLGNSMGAVIALGAAARLNGQDQVERATSGDHRAARRRIQGVVAEAPYRLLTEPIVGHLWVRRWPPYPFVWLIGWHFAVWFGATPARFDRVKHAQQLNCPLLVMHGTADRICPLRSGRAIAEAAPGGTLVAFDGADHQSLAKYDPARYRDALARFFDELSKDVDEHE